MNFHLKLLLLCFFLSVCTTLPSPKGPKAISASLDAGLSYLNKLREDLGMVPLKPNKSLILSSKNHARYLARYNKFGHYENPRKRKYFTGNKPADRTMFANYKSKIVSENAASIPSSNFYTYLQPPLSESESAVNSLMTAIYHRFEFLSYTINEIGYGMESRKYVYNMGNSFLNHLCSEKNLQHAAGRRIYIIGACANKKKKIFRSDLERANNLVIERNPKVYVLYPGPDFKNVYPVFYDESPDPLPDLSVSGNPISMHLSPRFKKKIQIIQFRLRNDKTKKNLSFRQLNLRTDPNKKLKKNFFAFFPLLRLDWNTSYSASLSYKECTSSCKVKKRREINWSFKTRDLKYEITTLNIRKPKLYQAVSRKKFILYFKPEKINDEVKNLACEYKLRCDYIDTNTVFFDAKDALPEKGFKISYKVKNKRKQFIVIFK